MNARQISQRNPVMQTFHLDESHPFAAWNSCHDRRNESWYDMHYAVELGVVLSGTMRRYAGSHSADVGPGEVWFCGIWEPHGYTILEEPCEVAGVVAYPQALASMRLPEAPDINWLAPFTAPPADRPRVTPAIRPEVQAAARHLQQYTQDEARPEALLDIRLSAMRILLATMQDWDTPSRPGDGLQETYGRLAPAMDLVFRERRFASVDEGARACGMGRGTFQRRFKQVTGITFARFALRRRLAGAAAELLQTGRPLKAIAADWGFTDVPHLTRAFHAHYGCTPGTWRRGGT